MISVTTQGTAFKAVSTSLRHRTKEELQTEESETTDAKVTSEKKTNSNMVHVMFSDPTNNKTVQVELTQENVDRLKNNFKSDDFYQRKDGTVRLSGKTEVFVSGWYGDIAYNRSFLKADKNNDGKLSDDEYSNTKNGFMGEGVDHFDADIKHKTLKLSASEETILQSYISPESEKKKRGDVRYNDNYKADSLENELNTTLRIDKNFDSEITLSEAYKANRVNDDKSDAQIVVEHISAYYGLSIDNNTGSIKNDAFHSGFNKLVGNMMGREVRRENTNKDEKENDLTLAQKATQKLISANGNEAVLSAEEKEAIRAELNAVKQDIAKRLESEHILDVTA